MNTTTLKNDIKSGNLRNFYIFTGPEWQGQKTYINQIAKVKEYPIKRVDSIGGVYNTLQNISLFANDKSVYVARDDKEFMQSEKLQSNIKDVLKDNVYILLLTNVDKRTKFYKAYKEDMIEFDYFDDKVLTKYIKQHINLSDANCKKLIDICESDYGRILLEIDKILCCMVDAEIYQYDMDGNEAFEILLKDGTIYVPPKDVIFDLVGAILKGSAKSWDLLYQAYAVGEANMVILSVLYNNAKQVYQVQQCKSSDISKSTGLTGWQIKCAKEYVHSPINMRQLLEIVADVEMDIKTGKIEEQYSMEYVLTKVLG